MQSEMHDFTQGVEHFRNSLTSAPVQPSHSLLLPSHCSSHLLLHSGAHALSLVMAMTLLLQSSPLKPSLHTHLPSLVLHLPLEPPPHAGVPGHFLCSQAPAGPFSWLSSHAQVPFLHVPAPLQFWGHFLEEQSLPEKSGWHWQVPSG